MGNLIELPMMKRPIIDKPLSEREMASLFQANAVYFHQQTIPEYRVLELFGDYLAPWLVQSRRGTWSDSWRGIHKAMKRNEPGVDDDYIKPESVKLDFRQGSNET